MADLMVHRKTQHPQVIKQCRNFQEGFCRNSQSECWYSHEEGRQPSNQSERPENSSVFWKVPKNSPPDDLMTRVVEMMEKIMTEVAVLKRESGKQQ